MQKTCETEKNSTSYARANFVKRLDSELEKIGFSHVAPWIFNGITPGLNHLVGNKITFQMICVTSGKIEREGAKTKNSSGCKRSRVSLAVTTLERFVRKNGSKVPQVLSHIHRGINSLRPHVLHLAK